MSRFFSFLFGITWSVLATAQLTGVSIESVLTHDASIDASLDGFTTYRVYADVTSSTDFVSAVFGDAANPLVIGCTGTIYQSEGANFNYATEVNPLFFGAFPAAEYDSWLTIGSEDANGGVNVQNTANTMAPALVLFNAGEGFTIDDPIGANWFNVFPCTEGEAIEDCAAGSLAFGGDDNRVLIAQITATGDVYGILNLQVFPNGVQEDSEVVTGVTCSTNVTDVFGCTNPAATNFDMTATLDDFSCILPCSLELSLETSCGGLIEVSASGAQGADYFYLDSLGTQVGQNFGNFAGVSVGSHTVYVVDGVGCVDSLSIEMPFGGCLGCTDPSACNYDDMATTDDGSCDYPQGVFDCDGNSLCGTPSLSTLTVEVTENVLDDLDLYKLYVDLPPNSNWYVSAVAGDQSLPCAGVDPSNNLRLTTMLHAPDGVFNTTLNPSWNASGLSTAFLGVFPELAFDSFATIGLSGPASEAPDANAADPSFVGDEQTTPDFLTFFNSSGAQNFEMQDGAWYITPVSADQAMADENGRCLIGQLSSTGPIQGQLIVQILDSDLEGSNTGDGEVARYNFHGPGMFQGFTSGYSVAYGFQSLMCFPTCGCDDSYASNYIPWVELGVDTCEYDCTDEDEDGICDEVDDCVGEYDSCGVCNGPGAVLACGCTDVPEGDCDCEGSQLDVLGVCGGGCLSDQNGNGVCDDIEVFGCTYELGENYSLEATIDDGSCIFPCEGAVNINVFDWDGDYAVTVTDFLMMLSVYGDVDVDLDGIWDSGDLCVDTNACNYATDPSEPCASLDVLGICGGGCEADEDADGICDDVDTCVGIEDECGVCNGPGPTEIVIEDITVLYDSVYLPQLGEWYVYEFGADTTFSYTCAPPSFSTCGDPVSYQGYDYATVLIGDQCWFAENLRNENYENGEIIASNLSDEEWLSSTVGAIAVYGDGIANCDESSPDGDACDESWALNEYGRLYNWYAVEDPRGLCPSGWSVPSDAEWMTLEIFLGMSENEANETSWRGSDEGVHMKATYGWYDNSNGSNSSGFAGLPGGYRTNGEFTNTGEFLQAGLGGYWWSASASENNAWYRFLTTYFGGQVGRFEGDPNYGLSVRCVRDAE